MFMASASTFYPPSLGGSRPRRHIAPHLRAAGVAGILQGEDVMYSMKQQDVAGTGAPPRRPRGPTVADKSMAAGVRGQHDHGVEVCLKPGVFADKMNTLVGEQRDRRYQSNIRAPLGRVPDPKLHVPDDVMRRGFGVVTAASESAGRLIYEGQQGPLRHQPGAQTNRNYEWAKSGIDPTQFVFGGSTATDSSNCVANLLGSGGSGVGSSGTNTVIFPKITQDFKSTTKKHQPVGGRHQATSADASNWLAESVGPGGRSLNDSIEQQQVDRRRIAACNGSPNVSAVLGGGLEGTTWGLRSSANGGGGENDEDDDVGRSAPGSRKLRQLKLEDEARRRQGQLERLASGNTGSAATAAGGHDRIIRGAEAYDDEITVPQLLYPCYYVKDGIQSKYFAGGRTFEDCCAIATKLNFGLTGSQMRQAFDAAAGADGLCGIEQFKNAALSLGFY